MNPTSYRQANRDECVVIGNGPSAQLVDFAYLKRSGISIIGMNSAFRYWRRVGTFADYYVSIDSVVTRSNSDEIKELVETSSIKLFVLADDFTERFPSYTNHPKVLNISKVIGSDSFRFISSSAPRTTGAWALRLAAELGYKFIHLAGFDGIRQEILLEATQSETHGPLGLIMKSTPTFNPNYFFADYQREGDAFQVPNADGFTKQHSAKLHTTALRDAIIDIQTASPVTTIQSHSIDDYTNILDKTTSLGKLNSKHTTTIPENYASRKHILNTLKKLHPSIIPEDLHNNKQNIFHFGRPTRIQRNSEFSIDIHAINESIKDPRLIDHPTLYIRESDIELQPRLTLELSIHNYMKHRAMIEFESKTKIGLLDMIELLRLPSSVEQKLIEYPLCLFVDQSSPRSNHAHAIKLATKDLIYYHAEKQGHLIALPRRKSGFPLININYPSPGSPGENLELQRHPTHNAYYIVIYHNTSQPKAISITLEIYCTRAIEVSIHVAPNKTTPSTREQQARSIGYRLREGINRIHVSRNYEHNHNASRCHFACDTYSDLRKFLKIHLVSVLTIDQNSRSYTKRVLSRDYAKETIPFYAPGDRASSGKTLLLIEPDMKNKQGHYFCYANNILSHSSLRGHKKIILARKDLPDCTTAGIKECLTIGCYDTHSWAIASNMERFSRQTLDGLSKTSCNGSSLYIYMYTGSVFHAIELIKVFEKYHELSAARVSCNLFWEMIKDVHTQGYLDAFAQLRSAIRESKIDLNLTAPTQYVQELISQYCGIDIPLAPHPSTSFSDDRFLKVASKPLMQSREDGITIFFPGVDTIHKGYEYGMQICKNLLEKGYNIKIRPTGDSRLKYMHPNLKVIDLDVSEDTFANLIGNSDLIVLPYMPEGFSHRTSGLVVDALLSSTPAAVVENTWLAEFTNKYNSGIVIPGNSAEKAAAVIDSFISSARFSERLLLKPKLDYFSKNSWRRLICQIFGMDS